MCWQNSDSSCPKLVLCVGYVLRTRRCSFLCHTSAFMDKWIMRIIIVVFLVRRDTFFPQMLLATLWYTSPYTDNWIIGRICCNINIVLIVKGWLNAKDCCGFWRQLRLDLMVRSPCQTCAARILSHVYDTNCVGCRKCQTNVARLESYEEKRRRLVVIAWLVRPD